MLSLQEISDRMEIQDLITDYSHAIDEQAFDRLDDIFTPDAFIDYTATGGEKGDLAAAKAFLAAALPKFPCMQHIAANSQIRIKGDTATCRTILFNPMVFEEDGGKTVFFVGAWYLDDLVRTEAGWRISKRIETQGYMHNTPKAFQSMAK